MNAMDVNLYLVGFMGTGKSTVGRAVAHKLGFRMVDSDHEIERQQRKTIPEIFAQDGEAAFRAMERVFIESGHPAEGTVVSCGGGLVVQPGMLARLKRRWKRFWRARRASSTGRCWPWTTRRNGSGCCLRSGSRSTGSRGR